MSRILVGTTSWTEKTLVESGRFYPPDVHTPEARLRFYATQFPVVEVDSSYYGLPSARNASLWVERTPDGFVLDVKAFRLFTQHQTPPDALPREIRERLTPTPAANKNIYYQDTPPEILDELWERFRSALDPLRRSGKLGVVLFQFAPWFVFRPSSLDLIATCAAQLPGDCIAVEFRNKSWFSEKYLAQTLAFERAHGLVHVVVDEPQGFPSSVPAIWADTSPDLAIVRLHGRNRATWQKKGISAAERFNYLYSAQELRRLVGPVTELGDQTGEVHVLFNNCYRDNAQRNARSLQALISSLD
jgi:uncharacterized protein YecE (DUF72 family)